MVAKTSRKTRRTASTSETTVRHLWLAALGAVSVARREALTAAGIAYEEALKFRRNAARVAGDVRDIARGAAMTVQEHVQARVEPKVGEFSAEVEARLAPVLDKLGLKPQPKKPARKARKAAKPQARRSAAARKQAATRVARKGRA